jgi:hypothetical protein
LSNVTDFAKVTTQNWDVDLGGDFDAAFIANLEAPSTTVPEPNTLALLIVGGIALVFWSRKRRQQARDIDSAI